MKLWDRDTQSSRVRLGWMEAAVAIQMITQIRLGRRGLRPLLFCNVTSIKEIMAEVDETLGNFYPIFTLFYMPVFLLCLVSCGLAGK